MKLVAMKKIKAVCVSGVYNTRTKCSDALAVSIAYRCLRPGSPRIG